MKKCLLISVISLLIISCQKSEDNPPASTTPPTVPNVTIGTQTWSVNNLDVITYRNGDPIPQVTDVRQWATLTTGAWCYYNNDSANNVVYGKLYNWYAVNDSRGLVPLGWHIPSDEEWYTLIDYLGGVGIAGGKMKSVSSLWISPNTGATNSSGFSGLPAGLRGNNGNFFDIREYSNWWSTKSNSNYGRTHYLWTYYTDAFEVFYGMSSGCSVRCVKD